MKRLSVFQLFCYCLFFHNQTIAQPSIPVDPLTGRAAISIPIWQMSKGDLSVPISISYTGNGVRVDEGEGSAGMSWNLNAGGAVSREVRGWPDDYQVSGGDLRKGWLYNNNALSIQNFTSTSDDDLSSCNEEYEDYNFLTTMRNGANDTEPDVFNFFAPGLSGQFVFGSDGLPKLIPYQDLKLVVTRANGTGPIDQIVITNNIGIAYTFSVKETTRRHAYKVNPQTVVNHLVRDLDYYGVPLTYTSSWNLAKITSPTGSEVLIGYTQSEQTNSIRKVTIIDDQSAITNLYNVSDLIDRFDLTSINTDASQAVFTWEKNKIGRISVSYNNANPKQFDFVYEDVRDYRASTANTQGYRGFLKEIRQQEDCMTFPSHSFLYDGVDFVTKTTSLSFKDKNLKDLWGYYNGTSASNIPDIYVYTGQVNAERFRFKLIPNQSANQTLTGANREVNPALIATGTLNQINYPSGSSAIIEYEPNQYYDATAAASYLGGGVRVKKVTLSGGERGSENIITDYEYLGVDGQTSGRLMYRPVFAFYDGTTIIRTPDNLAPESGLYYLRTTVKQTSKGKTVYEFLAPAMYPSTTYGGDWNATKSKVARAQNEPGQPCYSIGNQINGYYHFPFPQNANYDFERGLLDKVKDYNEAGTLVQEKIYSYIRLSTTPILIKGLAYEKYTNNFVFGLYTLIANQSKLTQTETVRRYDDITIANNISSATTYDYNPTHFLLQMVTVTNSDEIVHETKYKYAKDYSITNPNTSNTETVALKGLNDTNRHGEVIETTQSRAGVVTGASITLFKDFGAGKILPHRSLVWPTMAGFTNASITGSPQSFTYNSNYIVTNTIDGYNGIGMPLSSIDNKRNKSGVHYGYSGTIPLVAISNAYANEAVYEGFETSTSYPISYSGGTLVAGWAGDMALSIFSSNTLTTGSIQKGTNRYRFSCWAKSSGTPIITFKAKNGATIQATETVTYSGSSQWQYLEKELSMTGVSNSFTLEITSNANVELDEIRFYPSTATMITKSLKPLVGVVAQVDDRGVSSFTEYDELDRVRYIKNKDKHIVQVHDYKLKKQTIVPLNSEYTENIPFTGVAVGQQVQFTAPTNCGGVTYQWKVNGTNVSTSASFNYTFTTAGENKVDLIVSSTEGSVSTSNPYCVAPSPTVGLTFSGGTQQIYECSQNFIRTVTGTIGACSDPRGVTYQWFYRLTSMGTFQDLSQQNFIGLSFTANSVTFNLSTIGMETITIKGIASGVCVVTGNPNSPTNCDGSYSYTTQEQLITFTYVDEGICP